MRLSRLVGAIEKKQWIIPLNATSEDASDPDITSVHYRSQTVQPGGIFIAIKGLAADGHQYAEDAVNRGARAILAERDPGVGVPVVVVENTRKGLATVSSRFYDDPSSKMIVIGITGTNGKTTTTYIIENILNQAGFNAGVIGTINYRFCGKIFDNPMTTPESLELQKILSEMAENKVTHVVMEVSSHAIDLCRVDNCRFDVGVFTNLTQDHLDFHKDMETYFFSKKRFFTELMASGPKSNSAVAVVNCNDAYGKDLFDKLSSKKVSVGFSEAAMIFPKEVKNSLKGIKTTVSTPVGDLSIGSSLVGAYNIENILCAAGAGVALNLSSNAIESGINLTTHIPGRLDAVPNALGKFVYVDYAHTPDALENALETLSELKTGRIFCVFGCGGNRDRGKRRIMGEIAGRICDLAVVTTDNPRKEDPMEIIREIETGVQKTSPRCFSISELKTGLNGKGYVVIPDRENAVRFAIEMADADDIVLIAGKGHETYQIVGDRVLSFDDKQVARNVLKKEEETL